MDLKDAIRRQASGAGRGCAWFPRALLRRGRCLRAAEEGSRDAAGGEAGSALIETAASLPVLFVLIFCFMELCMAFYSYDMISESAREGTRYAMMLSSTCTNSSGGFVHGHGSTGEQLCVGAWLAEPGRRHDDREYHL